MTINKILRTACSAAIAGLVMTAVPVEASIWGWLERLSGPGPFEPTMTAIGLRGGVCPSWLDLAQAAKTPAKTPAQDPAQGQAQVEEPLNWVQRRAPRNHRGVTCAYFDAASFVSHHDAFVGGTSDVNAKMFGVGFTTLILSWLELGAGIGVAHFHVDDLHASVTRLTLTTGRLVLRPLRIFCPKDACSGKQKWLDVLKYYYKTDVIAGTLRSENFGVMGSFRERGDAVSSYGFLIDLSELWARK